MKRLLCCILILSLTLSFGAALADNVPDQLIQRITGQWVNERTGEMTVITPEDLYVGGNGSIYTRWERNLAEILYSYKGESLVLMAQGAGSSMVMRYLCCVTDEEIIHRTLIDGCWQVDKSNSLTFTEDHTVTIAAEEETMTATWQIEDGTILVTYGEDTETCYLVLRDGEYYISLGHGDFCAHVVE